MKSILLLAIVLLSSIGKAHPVAFKGATSLMSSNEDSQNDILLAHSVSSQWALGASYAQRPDRQASLLRANYLLKRWNQEDSQGNIYLGVGAGSSRFESSQDFLGFSSVDADWESRKYYIAAHYSHFFPKSDLNWNEKKIRLGVAPYLAEFTEINTWFIIQFSQKENEDIRLAQLLRVFYRNALFELGAEVGGGFVFNYMIHF